MINDIVVNTKKNTALREGRRKCSMSSLPFRKNKQINIQYMYIHKMFGMYALLKALLKSVIFVVVLIKII